MSETIKSPQPGTIDRRKFVQGTAAVATGLIAPHIPELRTTVEAQETGDYAPLREIATSRGINVGSMYNVDIMRSQKELKRHFNTVMSAGYLNWGEAGAPRFALRTSESSYNFGNAQKASRYAEDNNMRHEAHHLVWGAPNKVPRWLTEGGYSPDQLMGIVHDHVVTVAEKFKGQTHAYSVINEPFDDNGNYKPEDFWVNNSPLSNGVDPDYISIALNTAREVDPDAKLFINDAANEFLTNYWGNRNARADAMYNLIARLKDSGVPVDGVGMQMHLDAMMLPDEGTAAWRAEELQANMERFKNDLGVEVFITEFDIKMHNFANQVSADVGYQNEVQGLAYRYLVRAALASGACKNIGIFGVSDASHIDNWVDADWSGGEASNPVLLDDDYQPKPAYNAVVEELSVLPELGK